MKTAAELMGRLDALAMSIGNGYNNEILKEIEEFQSDILAEKQETRIKELTNMGEFKTADEAKEYCKIHGVEGFGRESNLFMIAGAIMDARKDQDKITRRRILTSLYKVQKDHSFDKDGILIPFSEAFQAIMNTKAIERP